MRIDLNQKGFTFTESMVLVHLQENPYSDLETMTEKLGISKGVISRALHTLEDNDIISWQPRPESDQPMAGTHQVAHIIHGWAIISTKEMKRDDVGN